MKLEADASAGPRFQPLAGETLQVRLTRPVPIPGETITVERVDVTEAPGSRARRDHARPRAAEQPGRQLPGTPSGRSEDPQHRDRRPAAADSGVGANPCRCQWCPVNSRHRSRGRHRSRRVRRSRTSAIELPGRAYNIALHLSLPTDRWPLFVGGPRLGPAVLYWGVMLVVIGVAWALSRDIRGSALGASTACCSASA